MFMNDTIKKRLMFIDPNEEWLEFVRSSLKAIDKYEVEVVTTFEKLDEAIEASQHFDLIFVGIVRVDVDPMVRLVCLS